jgi:hypothetical protein
MSKSLVAQVRELHAKAFAEADRADREDGGDSHSTLWRWGYSAALEHIVSVAESIETANGWQPIETAPKDGTKVDLWVAYGEGKTKGERWPDAWFGEHPFTEESGPVWQDDVVPIEGERTTATHWRPIPKGPGA